jgi:hypothetical protein
MSVTINAQLPLEADWRFADLIARAVAQPGLGRRYAADPHTVLAEFGLSVAAGQDAPALPELELIVEHLDAPGTGFRAGVCVHDAAHVRTGVCVHDLGRAAQQRPAAVQTSATLWS